MTRRLVLGLLVLAVLTGLALAARRLVERVPVTVRRGATLEVRRQPRLAFERLLDAGDADVRTLDLSVDALQGLDAGGLLLLDEAAVDLSRATEDALLQWVRRGGTLVLSPMGDEAGALSARVGVRNRELDAVTSARLRLRDRLEVGLPGHRTRFRVSPVEGFLLRDRPAWSAGDGQGGYAVAIVEQNAGRVVIVAGLSTMWRNDRIGQHDHAAFLWALATLGDGPVLLTDTAIPEITWGQLARRGWPVLLAGALLAGVSLWRVLPRMGPVLMPPAPERRQLGEHLEALGRFHVHHGEFGHLATAAQRAVQQQLARTPWQRQPADDSLLAVRPSTPAQFLQTVQRLHAVWRRLHRA